MIADVVVDGVFGDTAKGKIVHHLLKNGEYTHCLRFAGGANCGHTIYHNGKKFITHMIPAGVFFGVRSIIGPGCVLNVRTFFDELDYLELNGIPCKHLVKICSKTHIITEDHLKEEEQETRVGSTRRGVTPAVRDKYARIGIQAKDIPELKNYLVDFYEEFFEKENTFVLGEGSQGIWLDPHFGDFPYITSTHCTVGAMIINGIPWNSIRDVFLACKAYDTYVGAKQFQPEGEIFNQMADAGMELGATTGRRRQCNYLNIGALKKAVNINGATHLVVNKMDILQKLDCWMVLDHNGAVLDLKSEEQFKIYICSTFSEIYKKERIYFSYSPEEI